MRLVDIQRQCWNDSVEYFPNSHPGSPDYLALCLAGEVGEVANEIKKLLRGSITLEELRRRLHDELPDILIYLVMLAESVDVDLAKAYEQKREYNNGRYLGSRAI